MSDNPHKILDELSTNSEIEATEPNDLYSSAYESTHSNNDSPLLDSFSQALQVNI